MYLLSPLEVKSKNGSVCGVVRKHTSFVLRLLILTFADYPRIPMWFSLATLAVTIATILQRTRHCVAPLACQVDTQPIFVEALHPKGNVQRKIP